MAKKKKKWIASEETREKMRLNWVKRKQREKDEERERLNKKKFNPDEKVEDQIWDFLNIK